MTEHDFMAELEENLTGNIMPYWLERMADPRGGWYGRRDGHDRLDPEAPKGAILNARILWSLAAAYRHTGRAEYLEGANRAYEALKQFIDPEYGGVYWSLTPEGTPLDTKKQFYALGFAIYGLSEYRRATGSAEALDLAIALYRDVEAHSRDPKGRGYLEAAQRDWSPIADMRLSDKDLNASKTMNTHLHILEPYTNLLRVWPDGELKQRVRQLLELFAGIITDPGTGHLGLFFDDNWNRQDSGVSYGHDIEASWLMLEAAEVVGDKDLYARILADTRRIALASLEGLQPDGSMIYELHGDGRTDADRHWWVQAEAVIGQLYLWRHHGMEDMLDSAYRTWSYIRENLVDPSGEWHWSRRADGTPNTDDDKAGFWKCPYHNSRMCIEAARVLQVSPPAP